MLENYFCAPKTLRRLRSSLSGAYIDGFADALERDGYAHASAIRYLRSAAHFGCFVEHLGYVFADVDACMLDRFGRHFGRCRCPQPNGGGVTGYHPKFGVALFHQHLVRLGICRSLEPVPDGEAALVVAFCDWFRMHRGASEPTLRLYARGAREALEALGDDVAEWTVKSVRDYVLERAAQSGAPTTQKLITSLRAFLRYLNLTGASPDDLAVAVPAIASWRLAKLPRCLSTEELARVIAACDGTTPVRLRDHAILLLLARLGLRAGDVARLRLPDIDWNNGTVLVTGKGRYQVRLPLPQDVGDALLAYLDCRPAIAHSDCVFLRNNAPVMPFNSGDGISCVVRHALRRAGVETPSKGAHLLRHTAATEMLRHGVPLDQIGLVLRHRSIDMTAYYAKVDIALLRSVAQPWPGATS